MTSAPPKVFISYSHDTARHQERVLDLADRLRADGIDAEVDQYNTAPPEGWPLWCERQIAAVDFVLMVCTETYHRRVRGDEDRGKGLGVVWEARIIRQLLYDAGAVSDKFVPILFSDASPEQIPTPIKGWTRYVVDTEDGYEDLYRRLTGQPRLLRPTLGTIRALPPRGRQWPEGTMQAASSSLPTQKTERGRVEPVRKNPEANMGEKIGEGQSGGVNISGTVGYVGGDIVGRDRIIYGLAAEEFVAVRRSDMKVSWLHVSDFHFKGGDPYDHNVVLRALVRSVQEFRERGRQPDLIFATGDVGHSGQASEYQAATGFFDALLAAAGVDKRHLYVIPGNHDVDRNLGVGLARTFGTREEADSYFGPSIPKVHITQKQGAFLKWYNYYFDGVRTFTETSTCGPAKAVDIRGCTIGILPVNSALFCQGDDDHGKLWIGRRCLDAAIEKLKTLGAALTIALVHHPLDWLHDVERSNIRAMLQSNVDVILRGHLHETDVESVAGVTGEAVHIAAGAAYQSRRWPNRALYGVAEGGQVRVFPIRYEDQPRELWTVDPTVFPGTPPEFSKEFAIPRLTSSSPAIPEVTIKRVSISAQAPTGESTFVHADRPVALSPDEGSKVAKLKADATKAFEACEMEQADRLFEQVLAAQEAMIRYWQREAAKIAAQRGTIANARSRYREAAEHFARAAELAPEHEEQSE